MRDLSTPTKVSTDTTGPGPGWVGAVLVCGFGLWLLPSVWVVMLAATRTDLSYSDLLSLLALTGLSASCLRLTLGFWLLSYGRGLVLSTLLILLLVAVVLTFMLSGAPLSRTWLPALFLLVGLGGGGLAALGGPAETSDEAQRYGLEAASLAGHLGVVLSLLVVPLVITVPLPVGEPQWLNLSVSHFLGRLPESTPVWLGWSGLFWAFVALITLLLWSLRAPWRQSLAVSDWRRGVSALFAGGLLAVLAGWLTLPRSLGGVSVWMPVELTLMCVLALCVLLVAGLSTAPQRQRLIGLLSHRHLWLMSLLWLASVGTFLGLTLVFPIVTCQLFGETQGYSGVFLYAWMFPLLAILVRPLGGWAAGRWGGARVAAVSMLGLALGAMAVFWSLRALTLSEFPLDYLMPYLLAMALLFAASGIGYAALLRALPQVFPPTRRQPAQMWLVSVATLGMVYIPLALNRAGGVDGVYQAFLGFALFYGLCALAAWALYLRRHAFIYNP
ncbi:hypothetical protein [Marinimicrobium koreense]|uniref:hypothetical protein n=1 Tax=Marinimicrobium koreense TaxID=306545 RepID=UPI003F70CDE3